MPSEIVSLPGPSHHYAGYAPGNVASAAHGGALSRPRLAVLQCLQRMRLLLDLGVQQWFLPPLARPDLRPLTAAGFLGDGAQQMGAALREAQGAAPQLLSACWSAAAMWTANLGTVAPAADRKQGRDGLLLANLAAATHRALEWQPRLRQLTAAVIDNSLDMLPALPPYADLHDEGGANHTRLVDAEGRGLHCLVDGRDGAAPPSQRFRGRQSRSASQAVARRLGLDPGQCLFISQHPAAIDAGAFHNDVVMVGEGSRVLLHQQAWWQQDEILEQLQRRIPQLRIACIPSAQLSLDEAIQCYLFNSQLIPVADQWHLVAPEDCAVGRPRAVVEGLLAAGFIHAVHFCDLRQSMDGGGGPACLRLRVPDGLRLLPQLALSHGLITSLADWAEAHYPEELQPSQLADPALAARCQSAMHELYRLLDLPPSWSEADHG
ncbi:MAG: succinylarginine dihydrolase [Planctomycetota bacterium]|nr:MAG: succinylarginine dihydrolase [Planctomycetota bacterium]